MRKFLIKILVMQVVSNETRRSNGLKHLGRGFDNAYRFNPFNPLSYIFLLCALMFGILMFGFIGIWKETDIINPFKWN